MILKKIEYDDRFDKRYCLVILLERKRIEEILCEMLIKYFYLFINLK